MTTSNLSNSATGWMAIATGVSVLLAVMFLILMATVNNGFFGKLNDVFNSIIGISSVVLAWMLYAEHHARAPLLSQIALALVVIGAIFTIIGSILVMNGFTGFVLAGWYTGIGNALLGLWLLAFCYSMQHDVVLPHNLALFGLVVGAIMAVGLLGIPGTFSKVDSMQSMPWYLYVAYFGYLGSYVLYPIWTIWLGRNLLLK
jgi:hypothetical protein